MRARVSVTTVTNTPKTPPVEAVSTKSKKQPTQVAKSVSETAIETEEKA